MTEESVSGPNEDTPRRGGHRRRKEARPAEILEAGMAEFAQRGFAATRLEDVARRAGISKGTIYLYFKDKESLLIAAVQERVGSTLMEVGAAVDQFPGSTADLLRMIIPLLHQRLVHSELQPLLRIMIGEGGNFPHLTTLYYHASVAQGRALLERIVARGRARGEIREGPTADLPIVIMAPAIMSSIWQMIFTKDAPISPEAFQAAHLDLIIHGLLKPESL